MGQFNSSRKLIELFDFFNLIRRITNQNILGRFLLQLQMKTSLEVMNMNATYEIRSQHIVDLKKRNSIVIRRSILYIHFLVEFSLKYIIKHSNIC